MYTCMYMFAYVCYRAVSHHRNSAYTKYEFQKTGKMEAQRSSEIFVRFPSSYCLMNVTQYC